VLDRQARGPDARVPWDPNAWRDIERNDCALERHRQGFFQSGISSQPGGEGVSEGSRNPSLSF
jgi:hypothetical protein